LAEKKEMHGYCLTESIIPSSLKRSHKEGMKRFLATGEGATINRTVEMEALHRDGHLMPVELSITEEKEGRETYVNAFLRDITDKKKVRDELSKSRSDLMNSLHGR
jgi:two-component system sensor histidine kinase/response regulator